MSNKVVQVNEIELSPSALYAMVGYFGTLLALGTAMIVWF